MKKSLTYFGLNFPNVDKIRVLLIHLFLAVLKRQRYYESAPKHIYRHAHLIRVCIHWQSIEKLDFVL